MIVVLFNRMRRGGVDVLRGGEVVVTYMRSSKSSRIFSFFFLTTPVSGFISTISFSSSAMRIFNPTISSSRLLIFSSFCLISLSRAAIIKSLMLLFLMMFYLW